MVHISDLAEMEGLKGLFRVVKLNKECTPQKNVIFSTCHFLMAYSQSSCFSIDLSPRSRRHIKSYHPRHLVTQN